jgi:FkbM family methyltransferase
MDTKEPTATATKSPISAFLKDIEPFFLRRQVIYADIGANRGDTFAALFQSRLKINRACLVEANPKIFQELLQRVAALNATERATCLNIALSNAPGRVKLRDMRDMSAIIHEDEGNFAKDGTVLFDVETKTLDSLSNLFPDRHISILKIDVEGHEAEVLEGAETLLGEHAVEVIYIEAGVDPDNQQQTYYRKIEDILMSHGYRLFRIYEQTHEWIDDRPLLRRMNMAFISPIVAAKYPMSLLRELQALRDRIDTLLEARRTALEENKKLKAELADKTRKIKALTDTIEKIRN